MFWITAGPFFDIFSHRFFFLNFSISLSDSVHHFSLAFVHCIVVSVMIVITVYRFRGYAYLLCLFQIARQTCCFTMTFDNSVFSSVYVWQISLTRVTLEWNLMSGHFAVSVQQEPLCVLRQMCCCFAAGPQTQSRPKLCTRTACIQTHYSWCVNKLGTCSHFVAHRMLVSLPQQCQ